MKNGTGTEPVKAYLDTSLLVKRYTPEPLSEKFEQFLCEAQPDLVVSELTRLELASMLARKRRDGLLSDTDLEVVRRQSDADFLAGTIEVIKIESQVIQRALELMLTLASPVATLDAVHLATALQENATLFMTDDRQLARAAIASGLAVWPSH